VVIRGVVGVLTLVPQSRGDCSVSGNSMARTADPSAIQQLRGFIGKFDPKHQRLIRALRTALRRRLPTAQEMVYDNYNFFVIGYGATDRPSDAILSIAAGANGVSLCFLYGAKLPDPAGMLMGSGTQTRFVRVESANALKTRELRALIDAAVQDSPAPFPRAGSGRLIIRSVSRKQRPRRRKTADSAGTSGSR
jgi:hypothetical protein